MLISVARSLSFYLSRSITLDLFSTLFAWLCTFQLFHISSCFQHGLLFIWTDVVAEIDWRKYFSFFPFCILCISHIITSELEKERLCVWAVFLVLLGILVYFTFCMNEKLKQKRITVRNVTLYILFYPFSDAFFALYLPLSPRCIVIWLWCAVHFCHLLVVFTFFQKNRFCLALTIFIFRFALCTLERYNHRKREKKFAHERTNLHHSTVLLQLITFSQLHRKKATTKYIFMYLQTISFDMYKL